MNEIDFNRIARQWLAEGPDEMPDRSFEAALDSIDHLPRRRLAPRLRRLRMNRTWQLGAGVAASLILVAGGALLGSRLGPGQPLPISPAATVALGPPRLAFTRWTATDFAIWMSDDRGENVQPLVGPPSSHAAWAPDGSRIWVSTIAWGAGGETRIPGSYAATVKPDGSDFKEFSQPPGTSKDLFCLAWSTDGTRIACAGTGGDPSKVGVYTVRTSDGQEPIRLTTAPAGFADIPGDYSPDGRQIVFVRTSTISGLGTLWTMNADGSSQRELTATPTVDGLDGGSPVVADWSPDGLTILAAGQGTGYLVGLDGSSTSISIPKTAAGRSWYVRHPRWACDGINIVFVTHLEPNHLDEPDRLAAIARDGSSLWPWSSLSGIGTVSCGRPPA